MDKATRGFLSLNLTQSFGAANDNILKNVMVYGVAAGGIWRAEFGEGGQVYASLALSVPFVLFSGFAGQFSDIYSKRRVVIISKLSEILIAIVALASLVLHSVWLLLGSLILIAIQSTFFSPAKYGILPEILDETKLSRANGTINMFTYLAVILGTAAAGPLYDSYTGVLGEPNAWIPGIVICIVAILGMAACFGIPKVEAKAPDQKIRPVLLENYLSTFRDIKGTAIPTVILAWSYFYLIVGGIAIMILPDYKDALGITASANSYLFGLLAIGTGVGDYVAGYVSGHRVRPGLIPIGAIGSTVMFFVLGLIPLNYYLIAVCLTLAGFMAGFYMVPLQTMTQHLSSEDQRGGVLGLWSCMSFVGIIIGNLAFLAAENMFEFKSYRVFLLCGCLGLGCVFMYYWRWEREFKEAIAARDAENLDSAKAE